MKSSPLALLLLLVAAPMLAAARVPSGSVAPLLQDEGFRKSYDQAMKINAVEEMGRLIRRNDHDAVVWIIETCEAISVRSSEELEARLVGLRVGWERGMETQFVDKIYTYLSLIDPQIKRERALMRDRYDKARQRYHSNVEAKDGPTFGLLANDFEALAEAFAVLGDYYFASQCWIFYGLSHDKTNRGESADLYEACRGYKAALDARDALELKDRSYNDTRQSYTHLAAQGFSARPGAAPAGGEPTAGEGAVEAGAAFTVAMEFEVVADLAAFERPSYHSDDFYQIWDALNFKERGSTAKFDKLDALSPTATRRGASEVVIEVEGGAAGKVEVEVPMTGNVEPIRFEIGSGDERRPWAAITTLGLENDQYQGMQMNLAPSTGFLAVYWFNAGSMVGVVDGARLRVLDDNMDGVYGSPPRTWQNLGMSKGFSQPEQDAIVVGDEKRARPWSEFARIGEAWYRLEVRKGGKELSCTPTHIETGSIALDYSGSVKPTSLFVRGTGRWENCYFDLLGAKGKAVEVPAGRYVLFYGELRKGRRNQMMKTVIVPGREAARVDVRPGEMAKLTLGAPYSFDFEFEVKDGELVVPGASVVVVGSGGERYERPWNAVASPAVLWREKGSRRTSRAEEMPVLMDTGPVYTEGFHVAWFPRDLKLPLPAGVGTIEVQLVEKKHKLFGKIESAWKE